MTDTTTTNEPTIEDVSLFALNGADVSREDAVAWLTEQAAAIDAKTASHEAGITTGELAIGEMIVAVVEGPTVLALDSKGDKRSTARSAFYRLLGMPKNTADKYVKAYQSSQRFGAAVSGQSVTVLYELRHAATPAAATQALATAAKASDSGEPTVTKVREAIAKLPKAKVTEAARASRTKAAKAAKVKAAAEALLPDPTLILGDDSILAILAMSVTETVKVPFVKVNADQIDEAAANLTMLAKAIREVLAV
jgi:hypothetical protein